MCVYSPFVHSFFCRWPLGRFSCFAILNKTALNVGDVCWSKVTSVPEPLHFLSCNYIFQPMTDLKVYLRVHSRLPSFKRKLSPFLPYPMTVFWGLLLHGQTQVFHLANSLADFSGVLKSRVWGDFICLENTTSAWTPISALRTRRTRKFGLPKTGHILALQKQATTIPYTSILAIIPSFLLFKMPSLRFPSSN